MLYSEALLTNAKHSRAQSSALRPVALRIGDLLGWQMGTGSRWIYCNLGGRSY